MEGIGMWGDVKVRNAKQLRKDRVRGTRNLCANAEHTTQLARRDEVEMMIICIGVVGGYA
jgi:hypothetical protein